MLMVVRARFAGSCNGGEEAFMASAVARAYMGVWGLCPQWGPGAKPLVRGSGGRSPPEAIDILTHETRFLHYSLVFERYLTSQCGEKICSSFWLPVPPRGFIFLFSHCSVALVSTGASTQC